MFQNSLGFPRSLIFTAGQSGAAEGDTVRGVVDALTWGIGDQVVRNDFEPAEIDAADATAAEPAAGTGFAEMPVTLSGANGFLSGDAPAAGRRGQPVSVHYATADGTATAGQDYVATSGTLTFDPADPSTTKTIEIPILADTVADDGETVVIHLSAPVNGVVRTSSATLTITDTPPAPSDGCGGAAGVVAWLGGGFLVRYGSAWVRDGTR